MTGQGQIVPSEPPIAQAIRTDTEYVVLRMDDFGDGSALREQLAWTEVGRHKAKSPEAAMTTAIGEDDPTDQKYVAVALRYWSPVSFDVKVERSLIPKVAKS